MRILNLVPRNISIHQRLSFNGLAECARKFICDDLEVSTYHLEKGEKLYLDAAPKGGMKTYVLVEGALRNIEADAVIRVGDLIIIDDTQQVIHFDALEESLIFVHALKNSAYDIWENASEEIHTIMNKIQLRDHYTRAHCDNVFSYASELGRRMGLGHQELFDLDKAARFHDIGKVYIDDTLLNKPSALTPEEYETVKTHVTLGHHLICGPYSEAVYALMILHHERLDGSGYPRGLSGEAISLGGRILAVCDCYDAMTTDRVYRARIPSDQALKELRSMCPHLLDEEVVDALEISLKERPPQRL